MSYIDEKCINELRVLSAEMITKANSGHPGICLGAAPIMHTLFTRVINLDPEDPTWYNRDRFILSAGHGSALLYSVLHLSGFDMTMDDLKAFRQKESKTSGHPELGVAGVEMTTGPLGQGVSTAVGMALGLKHLASKFNHYNQNVIDNKVYVLCGDGDLQEGITMEAASLAGRFALNNLIVLFDSNDIQLDGPTSLANADELKTKFVGMGWDYILVSDGTSVDDIEEAINKAKTNKKPTIIEIKTTIGHGAENSGEASVHGKPLTPEGVAYVRNSLGVTTEPFTLSEDVVKFYQENVKARGQQAYANWNILLNEYKNDYPSEYEELAKFIFNDYKNIELKSELEFTSSAKISTRKACGMVLKELSDKCAALIGGSADLASSCMVKGNDGNFDLNNLNGRNICYGVREHAMAAMTNGLVLLGFKAFCGGFFVFSDYMKPSIRLAAIMGIPSLYIFSHDSIYVGEDGETHQPIEQLAMFRSTPNVNMVRPADAKEMKYALEEAFKNNTYPTVIASTRQDVGVLKETNAKGFAHGAYIAYEPKGDINHIIITCGSELEMSIEAAKVLASEGINVRVVSMPSMFVFDKQTKAYKEKVLPSNITSRLAVEMGSTMPWYKYAQNVFGIDIYGKSMPGKQIVEEFGFTVENIVKKIKEM